MIATNGHNQRTYPEIKRQPATEQEAAYHAALELVAWIDEDLTKRKVRHYRTKAGLLLTTLDEVIRAIISDNLLWADEEETEILWIRPEGVAV